MKETIQLRKLMESIDEYDDDDYNDNEDWNELLDIRDPYVRMLNTLATGFFDKYEDHSEFDHDYNEIVAAFDSGFDLGVLGTNGSDSEIAQNSHDLAPQIIEYMIDQMWALEHTSSQTHAAPSTLQ